MANFHICKISKKKGHSRFRLNHEEKGSKSIKGQGNHEKQGTLENFEDIEMARKRKESCQQKNEIDFTPYLFSRTLRAKKIHEKGKIGKKTKKGDFVYLFRTSNSWDF